MDQRLEFITRLRRGERLAELCREFGISRKTGHKFQARFAKFGLDGLKDRSRAPQSIPHKTPVELMDLIADERRRHPTWGGRKLKTVLEKRLGRKMPSHAAIQAELKRRGLVDGEKKRQRRIPVRMNGLQNAVEPNDVWCVDYKGQFRLGNRQYCYPLTVTDLFSRYILECEGMSAISEDAARDTFVELFRTHGLPRFIRSDNGVPFVSTALAGLTKLSAYWMSLGIQHERIRPAHPEENGAHERMHRTLKTETARPARGNLLQQQFSFDAFVAEFNEERPHEALAMRTPADVFRASPRPFPVKPPEPGYPCHDDVLRVDALGCICVAAKRYYVTRVLYGHFVGIREEDDGRWLVTFMNLDLGHFDSRRGRRLVPLSSAPPEVIAV